MQTKETNKTLSAAILKGTAANLAIQALGKNLNKKNILPTLVVGALGGGLSCLTDDKYLSTLIAASVFGGGNALANKASFPKTVFKYALIGTAGRLMLNIPEAVAQKKWETVYDYKLPNGHLPVVLQKNHTEGCSHATLISIAKYMECDNKLIQSLENELKNLPKDKGVSFYNLAISKGFNVDTPAVNGYIVGQLIANNNPCAITYLSINDNKEHTVGIERIICQQNIKDNLKRRFIIRVMDPLNGFNSPLSESDFNKGVVFMIQK